MWSLVLASSSLSPARGRSGSSPASAPLARRAPIARSRARLGASWLLVAWFALGTGCVAQSSTNDEDARPGLALAEDPWAVYAGPSSPVGPTEECRVTRIVDGDTLHCDPVGRIRLLGIDTPERGQEPFASAATRALTAMAPPGARVRLERDVQDRDRYDRALRYVWIERGMVNWAMVRGGHAVMLTYPPNVQHVDAIERAQDSAQADDAGLWAVDGFACPPVVFRRGDCP